MSQVCSSSNVVIGVGIDTARYGHHVSFLNPDRSTAFRGFRFPESRAGYQRLHDTLKQLADKHQNQVLFRIRIDAAGQYATNLETFIRSLPFNLAFSVGEPKRNQDYKNAHYPKSKSDPVDSAACARFAVVEQPPHVAPTPQQFLVIRDVVATLISQSRHTTRCTNQLHKLLARVFPELPLLANNINEAWVLSLLERYPTPARLAAARSATLCQISHVTPERAANLQQAARSTTGSFTGHFAEKLVIQAVQAVRDSLTREAQTLAWIELALEELPSGGHRHVISIPGIGPRTAAVLIAKIASIERFQTAAQLVSYFGIFPELNSSGVDKSGAPISRGQQRMSTRGCDFVRQMLWMAALSAIRANPPIKALYQRQIAAGKPASVALGHCMRKLLHQVFAIWKTDRPFDKCFQSRPRRTGHSPLPQAPVTQVPVTQTPIHPTPEESAVRDTPSKCQHDDRKQKAAAGRKGVEPQGKAVTATATLLRTRKLSAAAAPCNSKPAPPKDRPLQQPSPNGLVDYADLRQRVSIAQVLIELGRFDQFTGVGYQRRGPCPVRDHSGTQVGARHFSVNLERNVFRCLHPDCQVKGNALDLWAAVKKLPLYAAALDLAEALQIPLTKPSGEHAPDTHSNLQPPTDSNSQVS